MGRTFQTLGAMQLSRSHWKKSEKLLPLREIFFRVVSPRLVNIDNFISYNLFLYKAHSEEGRRGRGSHSEFLCMISLQNKILKFMSMIFFEIVWLENSYDKHISFEVSHWKHFGLKVELALWSESRSSPLVWK